MTQRILLMSCSRKDQLGYLEHAGKQIHTLLNLGDRRVETLRENETFPLVSIKGPVDMSGWPTFRG